MLNFLKKQSYLIFRCIAIQIGMTMFGTVLSMATVNNTSLMAVCGVGSVLFYWYLIADAAWSCGFKEQVKIEAGRAPRAPFTGLLASLVANLGNILLAVTVWVGFFLSRSAGGDPDWLKVVKLAATLIEGMYCGVLVLFENLTGGSGFGSALAFTVIVLPAPLICWGAYYLGTRGIHIVPGYGPRDED